MSAAGGSDRDVYDHVVVGSGAGGGPVAPVVDASVFPRIPGFFIVTAIYLAAEKASAAILADAARPPSVAHLQPRPRRPLRPTPVQETR